MSEVSDVRKAFEESLRRFDELIEAMRAERDRIKAESELFLYKDLKVEARREAYGIIVQVKPVKNPKENICVLMRVPPVLMTYRATRWYEQLYICV